MKTKEHWMARFKFIDLFAGIGGMRIAFERLGGACVFSSEWDPEAQKTYSANFEETPAGDITKIVPSSIPAHDILLAGFPCQSFSICGDMKGFNDTRGTLFFNIEMILKEKHPKAFLLENVKHLSRHDKGRTLETIIRHLRALDYHVYWSVLNALDFGLPQKRERTFIVGFEEDISFEFPTPKPNKASLKDVLEPDESVDPKLFASRNIREQRLQRLKTPPFYPSIWHENKSGNISVLPYSCALRAGASYSYLLVNGIRRPSSRELLSLQGFPDSFKIAVSASEIRKQTGNSVAIPVVEAVAKQMLKAMEERRPVPRIPVQLSIPENERANNEI
jgi:DNA (cytosine-5)-methyltransferase 1